MIISSLVEDNGGDNRSGEGRGAPTVGGEVGGAGMPDDDRHEYQTANQLFELMVQDHDLNTAEDDSLSQRDLVLIYKNLDLGTQLMSNANEFKRNRPNQYVETVVYKDEGDSDSSELSDPQYSSEDLYNMVLINKERIDLLNSGSAGNTLCNKLGDIQLKTSKLNSEYNNHNIYNTAYLKNLNLMSNSDYQSMIPDSLLDYICCKRLEDNYNFYMDSIIIYVKHTIDQLRRISEGDYLTDRVKEKWREVDSKEKKHDTKDRGDTKILATCTSIPLHIERKMNGSYTKWDEIVHSEVDRRSLSKILEKKIIIEVPKVICDSYKLFTKCCADNLVISCKKQKKTELSEKIGKDSRVDVVFQLKPSESGQVISNISSVMVLHSAPTFKEEASCAEPLRIAYKAEVDKVKVSQDNCKKDENFDEERVVEITENNVIATKEVLEQESTPQVSVASELVETFNITHVGSHGDTNVCPYEEVNVPQSEPTIHLDVKGKVKIPTADLLSITIQRLNQNALTCMPEESEDEIIYNVPYKKKLLPKRVKSPYENKTYLIEEKKRKHLLEIRQRREKKKKAMGENITLNIHKYGVDSMAPRASSSITQISISNKSFYNSIFGKASRDTIKKAKSKRKNEKSDSEINKNYKDVDSLEGDTLSWKTESSDKKKCINYDLDDVETEVMQMTNVRNESTSSPECSVKLNYSESIEDNVTCSDLGSSNQQLSNRPSVIAGSGIKMTSKENEGFEKFKPASECRKNISKIYDLVQKLGKGDLETKPTKSKFTAFNDKKHNNVPDQDHKTDQFSDSAGGLKKHLPMSNSNLHNLEINSNEEINQMQTKTKERINSPRSQIPIYHGGSAKGVKSLKLPTQYDNPLKAISELIHNIDNLKKPHTEKNPKFKAVPEIKPGRKPEINNKDHENRERNFHVDSFDTQTVKKQRPLPLFNRVGIDKGLKKKLTDILDEQKEARGEAVKGPPTTSRIDALAQPKKSYVQAHREEILAKSGRRWSPQKLAPGTLMGGKMSAKTSVGVSSRQQRNYPEQMSRRRVVLPTSHTQLERQRSPSPHYPAPAPASVSPPRAAIVLARGPATLSPPRSPMTSWIAATDHRQQNNRRHAKVVPDSAITKKETRTVKHVSYEDPVITHVRNRSPSPPMYLKREFRGLKPIEINPNLGETVQAIVNNMPSTTSETVTDLTDPSDCYLHFSKDNCISEPVSFDRTYSVTSNHEIDIFEDKSIVTEVQGIQEIEESDTSKPEKIDLGMTSTEMRKLEYVLNRQKLQGKFQKRLRIKNLTLSPDRSMRKMFVLQSGDAGSMLLDSTSDNYLINDASKHHFDWSLSNIPMQVNTIGYSFTKFKSVQSGQSEMKLNALCKCNERKSELLDVSPKKTCQCSSTSDLQCDLTNTETSDNAKRNEEKAAKENDSQENKAKSNILTAFTTVEQHGSFLRSTDKDLKSEIEVKSNHSADESNSLDVLVGLLNEIQKITTCQTNITNTFPINGDYETAENNDLEAIIKEAAIAKLVGCGREAKNAGDNPLQMLSITSLEKLRRLESDPSLYSLYISNIDDFIERNNSAPFSMKSEDMQTLPPYRDVEVNVNIPKNEYVSRVTDVPSTLLTVSLNKSTDVGDSLCRLLNESSTSTRLSLRSTQHQPIYVDSDYQCCRCTVDLPKNSSEQNFKHCVAQSSKIKELPEGLKVMEPTTTDKNICISKNKKDPPISDLSKKISDYCTEASELDHVMKIKRDILVTVYSILVFTVFAALSFPAELI